MAPRSISPDLHSSSDTIDSASSESPLSVKEEASGHRKMISIALVVEEEEEEEEAGCHRELTSIALHPQESPGWRQPLC